MKTQHTPVLIPVLLLTLACSMPASIAGLLQGQETTPAVSDPVDTEQAAPATAASSATAAVNPDPVREPPEPVSEAILIREPGPGSRITSPLHLTGMADPAFEQTLVVRLVRADGSLLLEQPLQIAADIGERGPFEADLAFNLSTEENVLVQILDLSPRDGGIVHLASTAVMLLPGGTEDITPGPPQHEQLQILRPRSGDQVEGGRVLVEGFGLASFENTLVVEVYDAGGEVVGSTPCMTSAVEPGEPGWFSVEVEYNVTSEGPGRVVVVDPLPVFNGIGHVASVPVAIR